MRSARGAAVTGLVFLAVSACARPAADEAAGLAGSETETATAVATATTEQPTPGEVSDGPSPPPPAPSAAGIDPTDAPVDDPTVAGTSVLAGQFTAFVGGIGGDDPCPDDVDPVPYVGRPPWLDQEAVAGETVPLCLGGFDPAQAVDLVVEASGGRHQVSVEPAADGSSTLFPVDLWTASGPVPSSTSGADAWRRVPWWLAPGAPVGAWSLTATQASKVATGTVEVRPGDVPRFARVDAPGSLIEFHASGFPSGPSAVGQYRPASPRSELEPEDQVVVTFVRELAPIVADDTGAGVTLVDPMTLGAGEWCVTTAATPSLCRWVTVD